MSLLLLWAGASAEQPPLSPPDDPCAGGCPPPDPKACVLGRGEYGLYLLDQGGARVVGELTGSATFFKWGRELDDDSELELSLHLEGDSAGRACCELLEDTRTWRREMMVVRDGKTVWGPGPLITIKLQRQIVHLVSRDIVAWLDARLVHNDYDFVDEDLTEIARRCIVDALTLGAAADLPPERRDVGILEHAQFFPAGKTGSKQIVANQRTAGEVLRELAQEGLDFTVVNRSLIVGADFAFGPIGPLRDEDFLVDIEVSEHGLAAATQWHVSGPELQGSAGGVDDYYGLIERAVEGLAAPTTQRELNRLAGERLGASNPPPVTVNVPSEAFLSPRAPVCPELLVPGTLVDISVRELCRTINVRQRLTALQVTVDDRGERAAPTIAPMGPLQLAQTSGTED